MRRQYKCFGRGLIGAGIFALIQGCSTTEPVSFADNVMPVLAANCLGCHQPGGEGFAASGFDMSTYEGVMKGTRNGPMVVPGDSMGSNLIVLMEGRADPSISMPHGQNGSVSKADIEAIRHWIDQGALNN